MQFLVYLTVLMVSISTVLLELHWLTSPAPQPKPAVQASAAPPPKVEGPSAALSPVYPRKAETVEAQAQQTQTKPQPETTGMATRAESPAPPPAQAGVQQASAVPTDTSASNNRCDTQACAGTYRSFRASDCTYQPFDGGERRLCTKATLGTARTANSEPPAVRRSVRDAGFRDRDVDRRTRAIRNDDEDDAADVDDGERDEPRLFLFGGKRRRW